MKRKGATTKKGGTKLKEENEGEGQIKNEYGQLQYHSAQVKEQIKKQNHHLSKFQEKGRSDFGGRNRVARCRLARGWNCNYSSAWRGGNKKREANAARCFSFNLARRVQSRTVKMKGKWSLFS